MRTSVFATTAQIGKGGGGLVALHELNALKRVTDVKEVLAASGGTKSIFPLDYGLPDIPQMYDYLATYFMKPCEILFMNGNPFQSALHIQWYYDSIDDKSDAFPWSFVDVPAHDQEESVAEHEKVFGIDYYKNYPHMKPDSVLWEIQIAHINMASKILCPSQYSKDALLRLPNIIVESDAVVVIPHGCDLPADVKHFPSTFRIGNAGVWGPDKGNWYGILAWNELQLKNAEYAVAGDQTEKMRLEAERHAKENNLTAHYRFLGKMRSLESFYNNISVYIQPSVTEGFGLGVMEAMAHGRPVIVSDGCGAAEYVGDGGIVVKKRNTTELKEAIMSFYTDPEKVRKMGEAARKIAEQYSWNTIEELYIEVINNAQL